MTKAALFVLGLAVTVAAACPAVRAQALAESAVIHANSGIGTGVAKAMGGHVAQSLSHTGGQFSYPPRSPRTARRTRALSAKNRSRGPSPIAIKSVVGGPAPCTAAPKAALPQDKPATPSAAGNCVAKTSAPVANAKSTPNEITVSF